MDVKIIEMTENQAKFLLSDANPEEANALLVALAAELPLDDAGADFIDQSRRAAEEIIIGRDDRLLVVVGPCSIHDPAAALDYAKGLREAAGRHASELCVIMRVFVEKPRTTVGWKGLIDDPGLDGSYQISQGLRLARRCRSTNDRQAPLLAPSR